MSDMDAKIHCSLVADGTYWEVECELEEDPNLSMGDVIEPVDNIWPGTVGEVNYIVEDNRKIYSLDLGRADEEDFLDKARESDKWNTYPQTT